MKIKQSRREFGMTALAAIASSVLPAPYVFAEAKKYDPGATDTEIKLGQTVPHSGPGRFTACWAGSAKPISRC